jgi:xanthine dehydrogenase accessory factor
MNFENFLIDFQRAKEANKPFAVVTLVGHKGSVPQELGARLIVNDAGYFSGTIGGGKLENAAIQKAKEYLKQNQVLSFFHEWNLQKDIGMSCGGVANLFFEIHHPKRQWSIVMFGAGHVGQELARVLLRMECHITCIDSREEWLSKLPNDQRLEKVHVPHMPDYVRKISPESYVVVATMGHSTDLPILQTIFSQNLKFPYLGVIGSDVKAKKLRQNILDSNFTTEQSESFFCPIGEALGNNTPPEMAISIAAQLLRVRGLVYGKEA